jgi:hypothetical protein
MRAIYWQKGLGSFMLSTQQFAVKFWKHCERKQYCLQSKEMARTSHSTIRLVVLQGHVMIQVVGSELIRFSLANGAGVARM